MHGFMVWVASQPLCFATIPSWQEWVRQEPCWGVTPDPAIESSLMPAEHGIHVMTPEVPLWQAELAARRMGDIKGVSLEDSWWAKRRFRRRIRMGRWRIRTALASHGTYGVVPSAWHHPTQMSSREPPPYGEIESLLDLLSVGQWLEDELQRGCQEKELGRGSMLRSDLHWLVLAGLVGRQSAVSMVNWGRFQCRRCGSQEVRMTWCARCGTGCPQCIECRNMGVARGCSPFYYLTPAGQELHTRLSAPTPAAPVEVRLPFTLSSAQQTAATRLQQALMQGTRRILVWAACGAGKTEVVYGAIQKVVNQGGRVLVATPRRDVTVELCERMGQVFGPMHVMGLYGGAEQRFRDAPIRVSTTHQALRLHGPFELVILDECDAFPYTTDPALQRAIERLASQGCFIQMTATPPVHLRRKQGHVKVIHIPARHHGYPLPVPEIVRDAALAYWIHKGSTETPPPTSIHLVPIIQACRDEKAQLLVFVPRRTLVEPVQGLFQTLGVDAVAGVHSGSSDRDAIRSAFAARNLDVVVATTVFERGLTFPGANVAVLGADANTVFNRAALVQMAGRVGRTVQRPTGQVWFLCRQETAAMCQAITDIQELNTLAAQEGLLREDSW